MSSSKQTRKHAQRKAHAKSRVNSNIKMFSQRTNLKYQRSEFYWGRGAVGKTLYLGPHEGTPYKDSNSVSPMPDKANHRGE